MYSRLMRKPVPSLLTLGGHPKMSTETYASHGDMSV